MLIAICAMNDENAVFGIFKFMTLFVVVGARHAVPLQAQGERFKSYFQRDVEQRAQRTQII